MSMKLSLALAGVALAASIGAGPVLADQVPSAFDNHGARRGGVTTQTIATSWNGSIPRNSLNRDRSRTRMPLSGPLITQSASSHSPAARGRAGAASA